MSYIPVLSPHLLDFMQVPVPILIGLNSSQISKEDATSRDQDAILLDLDTNMLFNQSPSLFCDCEKSVLCKKIQLIKSYYFMDYDRLNSYMAHHLEDAISDKEFVKNANRLLEPIEKYLKEEIFVTLARQAFLDVFVKGISKFTACLVYQEETRQFEFQEENFLEGIQTCSNDCKMKQF